MRNNVNSGVESRVRGEDFEWKLGVGQLSHKERTVDFSVFAQSSPARNNPRKDLPSFEESFVRAALRVLRTRAYYAHSRGVGRVWFVETLCLCALLAVSPVAQKAES